MSRSESDNQNFAIGKTEFSINMSTRCCVGVSYTVHVFACVSSRHVDGFFPECDFLCGHLHAVVFVCALSQS